jgi:glycosyltransferase involved in cell wall biosynthesis
MLERASVIVVVPARNEAPRIGEVLRTLPPFVDRVIVVDDGSDDATEEAVARVTDTRISLVRHATPRGVGAAIAAGYRAALTLAGNPNDAFVVMAGDGQMDPSDLACVAGPIVRGEAGYTKGNRFEGDRAWHTMPLGRRIAGEILSRATGLATGLRIHDSQCGYTGLARWACAALDLDALWPRYGYPNDLLGQLAARRIPVREVIVRPIYRGEPSGVRPWHVARIAWLLGRIAIGRLPESVLRR